MQTNDSLRNGYDAFISHNHTDKAWVRTLAGRLADVDYHGRPLRPWLDEQYLDPGDLGRKEELTTALDRSRLLLLVLSPASAASTWVEFEVTHFLKQRPMDEIVVLLKTPCEVPAMIRDARLLDFTEESGSEQAYAELLECLCPSDGPSVDDATALIDRTWDAALEADPGGLDAEPTPARDAVLDALLRYPIEAPATEGLALTGFVQAGRRLLDDHARHHPAAYNMKMCLGECLAVAICRHPRYRQVAHHYLDLHHGLNVEDATTEDPVLAFVVARAYSKVAEIDPARIDFSALLRLVTELDAQTPFNNRKATVAMMIGRIAAKVRGTDLGDLLIQALSEGEAAGRLAAIGGIATAEEQAPSVFYVSELAAQQANGGAQQRMLTPPSRKLQALLFGLDLGQPSVVGQQLTSAKNDLRRAFGIEDLPYGHMWFALKTVPPALHQHRAPFIGTVVKATAEAMEAIALRLNASHVVCLTEPRIVESLFDGAGAFLLPTQDADTPQCRRLLGRRVPFAMLDAEQMASLKNGDHVTIEGDRMRVVLQK